MSLTAPTIDLLAASTFANGHPHELYAYLRENDPVHWHDEPGERPGFWAVMRHADVRHVNKRHDLVSHAPSSILEDDGETTPGSFVNLDPPAHTVVRKTALPDFLPDAVRSQFGRLQQIASGLVDEVVEAGECDLVVDVAGQMAAYVMADLLSIPIADCIEMYHYIEIALAGEDAVGRDSIVVSIGHMVDYARGLWNERQGGSGSDVLTRLANTPTIDGPMSEEDFLGNVLLLLSGAGDTTRHLIAGGMLALFEHPDQRATLQADLNGVMPTAVEEMLRWVTPVVYNRRMAIVDFELGGKQIRSGDKLAVYYGSANRDSAAFADADRFDVLRRPNPHVTFSGVGAHFCIGAHYARAEASAAIGEILRRMPDIQQSSPVEFDRSNFVAGPRTLMASFTPAARVGR